MSKGKIVQYIVAALVVVVLVSGVFSIARRISGKASVDKPAAGNSTNSSNAGNNGKDGKNGKEDTKDEKADNSKPMEKLKVVPPQKFIREGDSMKLDIRYKPANASNTRLKWSCDKKGLVKVSKGGTLTPAEGSGKNTVTVTGKATDGSGLEASFKLRILPKIDPEKPMIAITFDDGPNPSTTNVMLDVLKKNYARATFFCLGNHVEDYPEVVKREYDLGMEVGTHTYAHKNIAKSSESEIESEISKGVKAIKNAIGVEPELMRPPYGGYGSDGKVDKRILAIAKEHGLCCVNWSADTLDWKGKDPDFTYQAVMKAGDGDIVLLHDIHEYNVDAVKRFVPDLISEGYQLVTVTELYETFHELNKDTYTAEKNDLDLLKPGTIHNSPWPRGEKKEGTSTESATESGNKTTDTDAKDSGSNGSSSKNTSKNSSKNSAASSAAAKTGSKESNSSLSVSNAAAKMNIKSSKNTEETVTKETAKSGKSKESAGSKKSSKGSSSKKSNKKSDEDSISDSFEEEVPLDSSGNSDE